MRHGVLTRKFTKDRELVPDGELAPDGEPVPDCNVNAVKWTRP